MRVELMAEDGDEPLRMLFAQVFGAPIAPEMLAWKYGEGRGRCFGAFEGRQLVAHCGMTLRRALVENVPQAVAQLGDLMAAPGKPGGLSRQQSAFYQLFSAAYASLGDAQGSEAVAYGFPSLRAMRLGEKLGLMVVVDQMHELHFSPLAPGWLPGRVSRVDPFSPAFERLAGRLWRAMAGRLGGGLIVVRDADYLRYRYAAHPVHRYEIFAVRPRGAWRPTGMAVCRQDGSQWELMDLVADPVDMPAVVSTLRRHMASLGAEDLMLWLSRSHVERLRAQARSVVPLQFHIIANPGSCVGRPERFDGRWWLTSGDTDYR